ncbi:TrkA C-terminal domain-containing protein [Streptococcus parasuis]|uniref:TrkA C-terminal domain-containing protein n=1 Tax=Streptococcus parasuis TaxID=1501662 RepID=UPI00237883EE|nr:TrkA C-terminal domain-containing protein [Streptococcus parasuis]WDN58036.1 GntR family transcriptional regulator [Streptococcus parasuis]WDN59853.1 GntR family transcriptional regulator [Streptococcus parasuis]
MPNRKMVKTSKYQQIAVGVAQRIVSGEYKVGERIKSRSTLASMFGVSPETTRKALNILADMNIVSVKHGSGAIVLSKEKAQDFLDNFELTNSLVTQKDRILEKMDQQELMLKELRGMVSIYLDQTKRVQKKYPLEPYGLKLTSDSDLLGKQLTEIRVWHYTGAVIVGIERNEDLLIAPSPYQTLEKDDLIYFVGEEESYTRVKNLFNLNEKQKSAK